MKVVDGIVLCIRTLFCYVLAGLMFLFIIIPLMVLLIIMPVKKCRDNPLVFWLFKIFYTGIVWSVLVPVTIKGKADLDKPVIFVANHQSALDIPLLGYILQDKPHVWFALSYYATFPVLGFFIHRIGIPVDRNNGNTAARALRNGVKYAQQCTSHIVIFPEGGRFNDGKIHEFLFGFALLARTTGRPVIPCFMPYNGTVYPPYSFWVYYHPLEVVIGPQFVYAEQDTDELFVQRVHKWFDDQLPR